MAKDALLTVNSLKKYYKSKGKDSYVKAVDDVSFSICRGETLGLVGESGCGKSTLGRAILKLSDITAGQILFDNTDITGMKEKDFRPIRQRMQLIFQNPYSSLNPRMSVFDSVIAPLNIFKIGTKQERIERTKAILKYIGLDEYQFNKYPHEFSGGQRQRIVIARAIITDPDFIVCDEPVSALDVSVRAQVLNLMMDIQRDKGVAYLFISHDLSVVKHISSRIAVMYLGKIVELCDKDELYTRPLHPYTQALLSSIPIPDAENQPERIILQGDLPSPLNPPKGCRFHTRCRFAKECCKKDSPRFEEIFPGHFVSCHFAKEIYLND